MAGEGFSDVSENLFLYIQSLLKDELSVEIDESPDTWSILTDKLRPHSILPLMYWKVRNLPEPLQPPLEIVDRLRETFLWSRMRSLLFERQISEIIDAFRARKLDMLVLKGPALGRVVYPDPAVRPSSDIDLLLSPDKVVQAGTILEELGYKNIFNRFAGHKDFSNEEIFVDQSNNKSKVNVEVHWDLHRFSVLTGEIEFEELYNRAIEVNIDSGPIFRALHPVDELINSALHLVTSHPQAIRLIWLYDIFLLSKTIAYPSEWYILQERSHRYNARISLEKVFSLAAKWTALQLPEGFNHFQEWPQPSKAEINTWNDMVNSQHNARSTLKLYLSGSLPHKLKKVIQLIFPSSEMVKSAFPNSNSQILPLLYLKRWWKWLKKLI